MTIDEEFEARYGEAYKAAIQEGKTKPDKSQKQPKQAENEEMREREKNSQKHSPNQADLRVCMDCAIISQGEL
jgi:hypothetical protein